MKLCDFMVSEAIISELQSESRDEVIKELVESLSRNGQVAKSKVAEIVKQLLERENQGSTGICKGIAVPQIKHTSVK